MKVIAFIMLSIMIYSCKSSKEYIVLYDKSLPGVNKTQFLDDLISKSNFSLISDDSNGVALVSASSSNVALAPVCSDRLGRNCLTINAMARIGGCEGCTDGKCCNQYVNRMGQLIFPVSKEITLFQLNNYINQSLESKPASIGLNLSIIDSSPGLNQFFQYQQDRAQLSNTKMTFNITK